MGRFTSYLVLSAVVFLLNPFGPVPCSAANNEEHSTANFRVSAADAKVAKLIGERAEEVRRDLALQWFGEETAKWAEPCPLSVAVDLSSPSGATEFTFSEGKVAGMRMKVRGPLDRLAHSVVPHEVMHTLLAHHFSQPVPRWVDEGIAVCAEDGTERARHDREVRSLIKQGKAIPMATLFALNDYPSEGVLRLYAQGYSVTDFLVRRKDRATLLAFVREGMKSGWAEAAKSCYGYESVESLEEAWLKDLREHENANKMMIAAAVEVHCIDGSVIKGIFKEEKIELATPYGKLLIPVSDIHKIDVGVRPTAEERKRIEAAIADLGQKDKCQAAGDALLALKEKAYPALKLAVNDKDAKSAERAALILKNLRMRIPEETLEECGRDVIHTAHSKISGQLQTETLRLSTIVFGEQQMKLAGVRSVRSQAYAEKKAEESPPSISEDPPAPPRKVP